MIPDGYSDKWIAQIKLMDLNSIMTPEKDKDYNDNKEEELSKND